MAPTAIGLALVLGACGSDTDARSEANYCTQVGNHLADLGSTDITDGADVDRVVRAWRAVAGSAPLAIEAEWDTMLANLETAITVDPTDQASMQRVADTARASEPAANRVIAYTQQRCNALIGSVAPTATTVVTAPPETAPPETAQATLAPDTTLALDTTVAPDPTLAPDTTLALGTTLAPDTTPTTG
jgi:hypothetical protein